MNKKEKVWNRCDDCGRFIAYKDFEDSSANIAFHLTYEGRESYTTTCHSCIEKAMERYVRNSL